MTCLYTRQVFEVGLEYLRPERMVVEAKPPILTKQDLSPGTRRSGYPVSIGAGENPLCGYVLQRRIDLEVFEECNGIAVSKVAWIQGSTLDKSR